MEYYHREVVTEDVFGVEMRPVSQEEPRQAGFYEFGGVGVRDSSGFPNSTAVADEGSEGMRASINGPSCNSLSGDWDQGSHWFGKLMVAYM